MPDFENQSDVQEIVEDATFDHAMGDSDKALEKLAGATATNPESFDAWHAVTEIHYSRRDFEAALQAAEKAYAIEPDNVHINTSLSRIHMERGDKPTAEHFGARARMLGWKEQINADEDQDAL